MEDKLMKNYKEIDNLMEKISDLFDWFNEDTIPQNVVTDVSVGDFLKDEDLLDMGHEIEGQDGRMHYRQYFTAGKAVDHIFRNNHLEELRLLQTEFEEPIQMLEKAREYLDEVIVLCRETDNTNSNFEDVGNEVQ